MEEVEEKQEKIKGKFGILLTIVFTGFLTGLFFGISKKTGYSLDTNSIFMKTVGNFCDVVNSTLNYSSTSCGINFTYVAWILTGFGIIEIFISISKLKNWVLGIAAFAIGCLIGFIIV
jgi:hypothetical protein